MHNGSQKTIVGTFLGIQNVAKTKKQVVQKKSNRRAPFCGKIDHKSCLYTRLWMVVRAIIVVLIIHSHVKKKDHHQSFGSFSRLKWQDGRTICTFFFLDELRKFTISDLPKQTHLGYTLITLFFFPTSSNQSTLHQNVFVLATLAQAVGWKTMSKCGSIRGWRKKIKWSICAQNVSA